MAKNIQAVLNKSSPANNLAKVGDILNDLLTAWNKLVTGQLNVMIVAATLAIKQASSPTVKSSSAFQSFVNAGLQNKSANTDMAAISGTLATAKYAGWVFYIDKDGALSASSKTADQATSALALADVAALSLPDNKAIIGYIIVYNNSGSNFTGGTTALDATDVTTTYYNASAVSLALTTLQNRSNTI